MATPSHVDLSVVYLPLMPETSKFGPAVSEAMEKAGKKATEGFNKGSADLPEKVQESFKKAADKAPEVFAKAGSDAGQAMADKFEEQAEDVQRVASDAGKKAGDALEKEAGDGGEKAGKTLADKFSGSADTIKGYARDLGKQLGDTLGQGVTDKVSDVEDGFHKVDDAIKGAKDSIEALKDAPGIIGTVAKAVGELGSAIAAAVVSGRELHTLINNLIPGEYNREYDENGVPRSALERWLDRVPGIGGVVRWLTGDKLPTGSTSTTPLDQLSIGGAGGSDTPREPHLGGVGGGGDFDLSSAGDTLGAAGSGAYIPPPIIPIGPGPVAGRPGTGSFYSDWYQAEPDPEPEAKAGRGGGGSGGRVSYGSGRIGSAGSRAELKAQAGSIANLYAVARSLQGTPYSMELRNDCSGMVSKLANAALGLPPEASFSTANEGDWLMSHGFQPGLGGPNDLNIGWHQGGPGGGHTAATLPGGVNAESGGSVGAFTLGGPVGAYSSQFEQHAHLAMAGRIPGGAKGPLGSKNDPLYTAMADMGSGGSGNPQQDMATQMGQGFLDGIMQSVGLDGSVFKGFGGASNPMDFGATKMFTGLLNWGMGMAQQRGGGIPGMGGAPGAVPVGPGGAQNVNTGDTHIYNAPVGGLNVTQNGVQGGGIEDMQHFNNSSGRAPALGMASNSGNLPPTPAG